MENITFHIPAAGKQPRLLPFGGGDSNGAEYTIDNISMMKDGRRMLPLLGEIHYSRLDEKRWEQELLKMKAGGLTGIATYVFWIHHEEKKGEWDFTGRRNLRAFITLCGELGLQVLVRIGPWCHGECRHGGFPDYIQYAPYPTRTNSPEYLSDVQRLYEHIAEQLKGLYVKDGGPIFGIQLENEYGHCGGPEDPEERRQHMETLKKMAIDCGIIVPFYTETGWGGTNTDQTLPVSGGYVDAPWGTDALEMPTTENLLFSAYHIDTNIASDWNPDGMKDSAINEALYPSLTAEMGGGLQVTSHRRPYAFPEDTEAQFIAMLGAGVNMVGYYMYHGGINPEGKYTDLSEAETIGGYTTVPVKNYDFQAPLNHSGRLNLSFGRLKKHHLPVQALEEELAGAEFYLPDVIPEGPEDMKTLRAALRYNHTTGAAFLFYQNHQRKRSMEAHQDVHFTFEGVDLPELPLMDIPADSMGMIAFNVHMGDYFLKTANLPLLAKLGRRFFFYGSAEPQIVLEADKAAAHSEGTASEIPGGAFAEATASPLITVLSPEDADRAFLFNDKLYITEYPESCLIEKDGLLTLLTEHTRETVRVYSEAEDSALTFTAAAEREASGASFTLSTEEKAGDGRLLWRDYLVESQYAITDETDEIYLKLSFNGDRAEVFTQARPESLADDWYRTGADWHLPLSRLGYPRKLRIRIYDSENHISCRFTDQVYYDLPVEDGCEMTNVEVVRSYKLQ